MIKTKTKSNTIKYILLTTIALVLSIVALLIHSTSSFKAYASDLIDGAKNVFARVGRRVQVPVGYENGQLLYDEEAYLYFKINISDVGTPEEEFNAMQEFLDNYQVKAFNESDYFKLTGLETVWESPLPYGDKHYKTTYEKIDPSDLTTVKLDVPAYFGDDTPCWNGPNYWENLQDRIREIPVGVNLQDFISRTTTDEWYHFTSRAVPVECINEDCPTYDDGIKYHYFKLDHIEPAVVTPGIDYYKAYYSDYTHLTQDEMKYDLKLPYQISNGEVLYNNSKTEYCDKLYVNELYNNDYFVDIDTLLTNVVEYDSKTYDYLKNKLEVKTTDCENCSNHYFDIEGISFESYSTDFDVCRATYRLKIGTEYHKVTLHYTDTTPNNTTDTIYIPIGSQFDDYSVYQNDLFKITGVRTWNQDETGFGTISDIFPADITSNAQVFLKYQDINVPVTLNYFDTQRNLKTETFTKTVNPADFVDGQITLAYGVSESFIHYFAYPHEDMMQTNNLSTWYCTSDDFELEWRDHLDNTSYDFNLKAFNTWTEPDYSVLNCSSCQNLTKWFYTTAKDDEFFAVPNEVDINLYHLTIKITKDFAQLNDPVVLYAGHTKVMCDFLTNSENAFEESSPNISYADCQKLYFWLGLTYPGYTLFDFVGDVIEGVVEVSSELTRFSLGLILEFLDMLIPDWLKVILGIAFGLFLIYWIIRFVKWAIKMAKRPLNTKSKKRRKKHG